MRLSIVLVILAGFFGPAAWAENALQTLNRLQSSSLLLIDHNGRELIARNSGELMVPASTVKVLTALWALEYWGPNYQFSTQFYIDRANRILWVRGLGDPFLVSEEIDHIVSYLNQPGLMDLQGVGVDAGFFADNIYFDGQADSTNPYDAAVSSLAANFNTVNVRIKRGKISSGESQTPLTPIARKLAANLPKGTHRINLGNSARGPEYFAEVLIAKMQNAGIEVGNSIIRSGVPEDAMLLFTHYNTRTLAQVIALMLEHSNNFIANQLYLLFGVEKYGPPAQLEKSHKALTEYIDNKFAWQEYSVVDGAGLSRRNRLSANQLIEVLQEFEAYQELMPAQNPRIRAKTGTLKFVSAYAGYLDRKEGRSKFAVMINQPVNYFFRERLAEELLRY